MAQHLLDIQKGFNFRDIGGYQTTDGKLIKTHKLVRSGMLNQLNEHDLQYLNDYGVRVDIDFRSKEEQEEFPDKVPTKAKYISDSVFPEDETNSTQKNQLRKKIFLEDPNAGYNNMIKSYKDIVLSTSAQKAYRHYFDELLANTQDHEAVLFHCTAGKDRTGMAAVYIMSILGVDQATIRQDYLASNQHLLINQQNKQEMYKDYGEVFLKNIEALTKVCDDYLNTALKIINDEYGSIVQYLQTALKVTPTQQKDLKKIYLVE
ncbi:tyrosine-protein phosphatase [Ligilactobacillus sp. LYQ135]